MNLSEKSRTHIDQCRFCWMCRHICPVGNATGQERNTARARALGLSLVVRGAMELKDVVDNLYECACCGACVKECVTGWDPVSFTKDARLQALLDGVTPEYITKLIDNCIDRGNAYGAVVTDEALRDAMAHHSAKTDLLLFLGTDARTQVPAAAVNAIRLMEKLNVPFTVLADEPESGSQLDFLTGASDETRRQMTECANAIDGYADVIAFDPADAKVMLREYKEWQIPCHANVHTFTAFLAAQVQSGALKLAQTGRAVTYQDPFQLARDLAETDAPRALISACAELHEMLLNRKDTMWAGNILMAQYIPLTIQKVAADRIENALGVGQHTIVTASVSEYAALKAVPQTDVTVLSLEELLLEAAQ